MDELRLIIIMNPIIDALFSCYFVSIATFTYIIFNMTNNMDSLKFRLLEKEDYNRGYLELLKQLTTIMQGLSQILQVAQIYPSGVAIPDAASLVISGQANDALKAIMNRLNDDKNGIKSNFVKVF